MSLPNAKRLNRALKIAGHAEIDCKYDVMSRCLALNRTGIDSRTVAGLMSLISNESLHVESPYTTGRWFRCQVKLLGIHLLIYKGLSNGCSLAENIQGPVERCNESGMRERSAVRLNVGLQYIPLYVPGQTR